MKALFAVLLCACGVAAAADYPAPTEGDFVITRFPLRLRREPAGAAHPLPHARQAAEGRARRRPQRRADHARHGRHRRPVHGPRSSPASCSGPGSRSTPRGTSSCCRTTSATASRASRATACARSFRATATRTWSTAEHALLTQGLGVNHLRLVMGTSMGGMHTWLWGERWPAFMDALMPLASVPGADRRPQPRLAPGGDRRDPQRSGMAGRQLHEAAARAARTAAQMLWLVGSNPVLRQRRSPTLAQTDKEIDDYVANWLRTARRQRSCSTRSRPRRDYDPGPGLEKITRAAGRDQLRRRSHQPAGARASSSGRSRACRRGAPIVIPLSERTAATARTRWRPCGRLIWRNFCAPPTRRAAVDREAVYGRI